MTLRDLPGSIRLAVGCFVCLVLGFALLAQRNLWEQVGGGKPAGPDVVLKRYHGEPGRTRLHIVLDPALPFEDPRNMSQFLGGGEPEDETTKSNRALVLDWVEAGAQESTWPEVEQVFTGIETCGACHVEGGEKQDLPFATYADVVPLTQPGAPYPLGPLLISAHNHLFGFAVLALLLSLGLCLSRVSGRPRALLILAASGGAALDIASWFLARSFGAPFHLTIMAGGALFGLATTLMALLILRDVVAGPAQDAQGEHG